MPSGSPRQSTVWSSSFASPSQARIAPHRSSTWMGWTRARPPPRSGTIGSRSTVEDTRWNRPPAPGPVTNPGRRITIRIPSVPSSRCSASSLVRPYEDVACGVADWDERKTNNRTPAAPAAAAKRAVPSTLTARAARSSVAPVPAQ